MFKPSSRRAVLRARPVALAVAAAFLPWGAAFADPAPNTVPTSGTYTAGTGAILPVTPDNHLRIEQASQKGIIEWGTFSIGSAASVHFQQAFDRQGLTLNRVVSINSPSEIFGRLTSNGQLFLVNNAGVLFAQSASVSAAAIVASTLSITDQNFLDGNYHFFNPGNAGSVVNQGSIVTAGGYTALIGPQVTNSGVILANSGKVALGAGDRVSLDIVGDGLISISVDQAAANAALVNTGTIQADGGTVLLKASSANALLDTVINTSGVIRAVSLVEHDGEIILDAGPNGGIVSTGEVQAGRVSISGGGLHVHKPPSAPVGLNGVFADTIDINVTGGVLVDGGGQIASQSAQHINAGSLTVRAQPGEFTGVRNDGGSQAITIAGAEGIRVEANGGSAMLGSFPPSGGDQTITVSGGSIDVRSTAPGGSAFISSNGAQSITVTNGDHISVVGDVSIAGIQGGSGAQTVSITGTGANAINLGSETAAGWSTLNGQSQTITAGNASELGSITITGSTGNGVGAHIANIGVGVANPQTIRTSGTLSVTGGTASAGAGIFQNNPAQQSISAANVVLQGGQTGSGNGVFINSTFGGGQLFNVPGEIRVTGGAGGNAGIFNGSPSPQTISAPQTINAGNLVVQGGPGGTNNGAFVGSNFGGDQTLTVPGEIRVTGGAGGIGNRAGITTNANQTINGNPNIVLTGGGGGQAGNGNNVFIQSTGTDKVQTINARSIELRSGPGIDASATLNAARQVIHTLGDVSLFGGGGSGPVNGVRIGGIGGSTLGPTNLTLDVDGNLLLHGGSTNGASLGSSGASTQSNTITVTAGGNVTLESEGAGARIGSSGQVPVTPGNIMVTAGESLQLGNGTAVRANGPITFTADNLTNAGTITNGGGANTGNVILIADTFHLAGGNIQAGAAGVFLRPRTGTNSFGIESAGATTLTNADIASINTSNFVGFGSGIDTNFTGNIAIGENAQVVGGAKNLVFFRSLSAGGTTTIGTHGVTTTGDVIVAAGGGAIVSNGGTVAGDEVQLRAAQGIGASGARVHTAANALTAGTSGDAFVTEANDVTLRMIVLDVGGNTVLNTTNTGTGGVLDLTVGGALNVAGSVSSGGLMNINTAGPLNVTGAGMQDGILSSSGGQTITAQSVNVSAQDGRLGQIVNNGIGAQTITTGALSVNGGSALTYPTLSGVVQNAGDAQTINASSVQVQGTDVGANNGIFIRAAVGDQSLTVTGDISIAAGAGGEAWIQGSPNGQQTIQARNITMTNGIGGNNSFAALQAGHQEIRASGDVRLTGGATGGTQGGVRMGGLRNAVVVTPTDLELYVDGDVVLTGGSAPNNFAGIGSTGAFGVANDVYIEAGSVILNSSATSVARIGHGTTPGGGTIEIRTDRGIELNGAAQPALIQTLGNVTLEAASISETANGIIRADTLTTATSGVTNLAGPNAIARFNGTSGGALTLVDGGALQVTGITTTNDAITLTTGSLTNAGTITNGGGASNANMIFNADAFNLAGGGIHAGNAAVIIRPRTGTNSFGIESAGQTTLTNLDIASIETSNFVVFGSGMGTTFTGNMSIGENAQVNGGGKHMAFFRSTSPGGTTTIGSQGLTTTGDVIVSAGGGRIVSSGGTVAGDELQLRASQGIGTPGARVQTAANALAVNNTGPTSAFVSEADDVVLRNVNLSVGGIANNVANFVGNGGNYDVAANGALTVANGVGTANGFITLTGGSLTNTGAVTNGGGNTGVVVLVADAFNLAGGTIAGGNAGVVIRPRTGTNSFGIESAGQTTLTNADLDSISTTNFVVLGSFLGTNFTGNMTVGESAQVNGGTKNLAFVRSDLAPGTMTIGSQGATTAGDVMIGAGGGALVSNGGTVRGDEVQLTAAQGIGTPFARVQTAANALAVNTAGDAFVSEGDSVTLRTVAFNVGGFANVFGNSVGGALELAAGGAVSVADPLSSATMVLSAPTVTEIGGGSIETSSLTINAPDGITLGGANQIARLHATTFTGDFLFNNSGALQVAQVDVDDVNFTNTGAVTVNGLWNSSATSITTTGAESDLTVNNNFISGVGPMNVNVAGVLAVNASSQNAGLTSFGPGAAQTISADSISVTAQNGRLASINNIGGSSQSITAGSVDIQTLAGGGTAEIRNSSAGAQTITVTGDQLTVRGMGGGFAGIVSGGNQTIAMTGAGPKQITLGDHAAQGRSIISSNGDQTISGNADISLTGGSGPVADGSNAIISIGNPSRLQRIDAGTITLANSMFGGNNSVAGIQAANQVINATRNVTLTGNASGGVLAGVRIGGLGGTNPTASNLTLNVGGDLTLTGGTLAGNGVGIGSTAAAGAPALANSIAIDAGGSVILESRVLGSGARIGSPITTATGNGNISITAGRDIRLNGEAENTAIRTRDTVTLNAANISEAAKGLIIAGTLNTATSGNTVLTGPNQVTNFSASSTTGDVTLNNTGALTVTGLNAGGDATLNNTGNVTVAGAWTAGGTSTINVASDIVLNAVVTSTDVVLNAGGGSITETGAGAVVADELATTAGGATSLTGPNRVGSYSGLSGGSLTLNNGVGLTVSSLNAGADATITNFGDVTLTGAWSSGAANIRANGPGATISEAGGGFIQAGSLTTFSEGATSLTGANQVASFNGTSGGHLSLFNTGALNVTSLNAFNAALTNNGDVTVNGPWNSFAATAITTTGAGSDLNVNTFVQSSGPMNLNIDGAVRVAASGMQGASLTSLGGQNITAKSVEVSSRDGQFATIGNNNAGNQTITVSGGGIDIHSISGGGFAFITNSGTGGQLITVSDGSGISVRNASGNGSGQISNFASGNQTIMVSGGGGIDVRTLSGTGFALISNAGSGTQTISVSGGSGVDVASAGGFANISNSAPGSQMIIVTGGEGIDVLSTGASAGIQQTAAGQGQTVTAIDSQHIAINGLAGFASISANGGTQSVSITGSGANAITLGSSGALGFSQIAGGSMQSVTAGLLGEQGSITIVGPAANSTAASIVSRSALGGAQTIATSGTLSITGGTAPNQPFASGIFHNGSGLQKVTAANIALQGGLAGSGNVVLINSSGGGNPANAGDQEINVAGGTLTLTGGAVGNNNRAVIVSSGNQTINGNPDIFVTGGASSGDVGNNSAAIIGSGPSKTQTINARHITLTSGTGGVNGSAAISGTKQVIDTTGDVIMTGGASTGQFSGTRIGGLGGNTVSPTDLTLNIGGSLRMTGGSAEFNGASIGSTLSTPAQPNLITINAAGDVVLNPGTAAGARIGTSVFSETIADGAISITAGGKIELNGNSAATPTAIRTLGNVTLNAGSTITEGSHGSIEAGSLVATSNGTTNLAGPNQVSSFTASTTSGNVSLTNTKPVLTLGSMDLPGSLTIDQTGTLSIPGTVSALSHAIEATGDVLVGSAGATNGALLYASDDISITTPGAIAVRGSDVSPLAASAVLADGALNVSAGNVSIVGGGALLTPAVMRGDVVEMTIGGELNVTGGSGHLSPAVLSSGSNIDLTVGNAVRIDAGSGFLSLARIQTEIKDGVIHIFFPNLSEGGYFVNGIEGKTHHGQTGFFTLNKPAKVGKTLLLDYGAP